MPPKDAKPKENEFLNALGDFFSWLGSWIWWGFDYIAPGIAIVLLFIIFGFVITDQPIVNQVWAVAWLAFPIALAPIFWEFWLDYIRSLAISKQEYILLEIKVSSESLKPVSAMEIVLSAFYQSGGEVTWVQRIWEGRVRPQFSLEIISDGGQVRMLMWMRKAFRELIEAQFYSQYPDITITEVPDYTQGIFFESEKMAFYGCEFVKNKTEEGLIVNKVEQKEVNLDAMPIKTYIDFELDKEQEPESIVDPLTAALEVFGSMRAGEHFWLQFVMRVHRPKARDGVASYQEWKKIGEAYLKKLSSTEDGKFRLMSKADQDKAEALSRNIDKLAFDTGIRGIYWSDTPEQFRPGTNISALRGILRPFNSANRNSAGPDTDTGVDYPWQDFNNIRVNAMKRRMMKAYRRRQFFWEPFVRKYSIYSAEEIATMFHLPSRGAQTPMLTKTGPRSVSAPINLPTVPVDLPS